MFQLAEAWVFQLAEAWVFQLAEAWVFQLAEAWVFQLAEAWVFQFPTVRYEIAELVLLEQSGNETSCTPVLYMYMY